MLFRLIIITFIAISILSSCAPKVTQAGKASYYAKKFNGRATASGEKYRSSQKTAAHRTLAFGTKVKVTNLSNGKSVKVRINDRGPHVAGRIIDVSGKAAKQIGLISQGVGNVKIEYKKKKK